MARKHSADTRPKNPTDPAKMATLWRGYLAMPARLTLDEVESIERGGPFDDEAGVTRRCALLALTKSGAELVKMARDPAYRETCEHIAASVQSYRESLAALVDLIEDAENRLCVALQSEMPV